MQDATPPAAPAVDVSNVKGSDKDSYLSRNVTIRANNKIESELSEIGSIMSLARLCFNLCIQTLAQECAQLNPSALKHPKIRGVSSA